MLSLDVGHQAIHLISGDIGHGDQMGYRPMSCQLPGLDDGLQRSVKYNCVGVRVPPGMLPSFVEFNNGILGALKALLNQLAKA